MARLPVQPRSEGWPPGSMVRLGRMELAGRRRGVGGIRILGGWGSGEGRKFYFGVARDRVGVEGRGGAEARRRGGRRGERIFGIGFGSWSVGQEGQNLRARRQRRS